MAAENNSTARWHHLTDFSPEQTERIVSGKFNIHPLVTANLRKKNSRPKLHIFEDHVFITMFAISVDDELLEVNFLVSKDLVVTYSKQSLSLISDTKKTLEHDGSSFNSTGHILYHLVDELAENHLESIDRITNDIRRIQEQVFDDPFLNDIGYRIFSWRNRIHKLRKCVEEEVEVIRQLVRSDLAYIDKDSGFFLQDLEDDLNRVLNGLDSFQEQLLGIIDLQTSLKADHMNIIMKTLTLVSVVFIPITFVAGIYGMNFEHMPELGWEYGYLVFWIVVLIIGFATIVYFKRRKWW